MASKLPQTMKAAVVDSAGPAENIHVKDVAVPPLKGGHVIVALDFASIGSWDSEQRSGAWGEVKSGTIYGADGSGHIAAVADDVRHLHEGDRVYAYSFQNPDGGFQAQYVSVPAEFVERVPEHIDQKIAGAMPAVAVTARAGLLALKLKPHSALLVFGASGGVGSMAVWLAAKSLGATVTGTARADAHEYVRTLGAAHAIDPHSTERQGAMTRVAPEGFDALFATASGDDLTPFLQHLRAGASFAYPNGVEPEPSIEGRRAISFDGVPTHAALQGLNEAIGTATIPLRVQEFALDDVVQAYRRVEQGHVIGKIVLRVG